MKKRRIIKLVLGIALIFVAVIAIYRNFNSKPFLSVTFVGYTNVTQGALPRAVFAVTNISNRALIRWGWEEHSTTGRRGMTQPPPSTLLPGQGEHFEVSPGNWPSWRLAVLSTDPVKGKWNKFLTRTPYVTSNQWDQLWFNRSFSPWIPGPLSVPLQP